MKTRWEVHFEAWDVSILQDRRFAVRARPRENQNPPVPAGDCEILVELKKNHRTKTLKDPDEIGKLRITVPGRPEETEAFACFLADEIKERLCFPHGRMTLLGGFLSGERLPETPEEEAEVGEKRYFVRVTIEELPFARPDAGHFPALTIPTQHAPLLRQFNAAKQLDAPIERYLAFFKILEKAYALRKTGVLRALRASDALFRLAAETLKPAPPEASLTRASWNELLKRMYEIRDNCAHLRGKTGYAPGDPRVTTDVQPFLNMVEELAKRCIELHSHHEQ